MSVVGAKVRDMTTAALLEAFLAHRSSTVSPRTVARDRRVFDRLHEFLLAGEPTRSRPDGLDEFTRRRLARDGGGAEPYEPVDPIVMGAQTFLDEWLPQEERRVSAGVLRLFAGWAERVGELDPCSALSLRTITAEYAPPPARRRYRGR
jgi:hypothetical protein